MTQNSRRATAPRVKQWYLTAPHHKVKWVSGEPMQIPYGVAHIRAVGGAQTACGIPAQHWPIYWLLELQDAEELCSDCNVAARQWPV